MSKSAWVALVAAVAAWTLVPLWVSGQDSPRTAGSDAYMIPQAKRHLEFTYVAEIPAFPKDAKRVDLWVPIPKSDANQTVARTDLKLEGAAAGAAPAIGTDPKTANQYAHYAFEAPFPASAKLTLTVDVTRSEYLRKDFRGKGQTPVSPDEAANLADFLRADKLVPTDGRMAELAKKLAGEEKNILNLGRRFYDHVLADMKYDKSGTGWGRGDAIWACDAKYGNCTDFHAVFIGLSRASRIPARFAIGFPIPEQRGAGEVKGYHCWAEFYVPGYGWVPVDISEADKHPELAEYYFGAHTEDRVEFTMGRDLMLVPPQKGEPLNFFVYPYAEVDGKAWDGVKRKFAYKDL